MRARQLAPQLALLLPSGIRSLLRPVLRKHIRRLGESVLGGVLTLAVFSGF